MSEQRCPACGAKLNRVGALSPGERRPEPGWATICCYCRAYLRWDGEMRLGVLNTLKGLDPELARILRHARFLLDLERA